MWGLYLGLRLLETHSLSCLEATGKARHEVYVGAPILRDFWSRFFRSSVGADPHIRSVAPIPEAE